VEGVAEQPILQRLKTEQVLPLEEVLAAEPGAGQQLPQLLLILLAVAVLVVTQGMAAQQALPP
jgi:hypothetical protein